MHNNIAFAQRQATKKIFLLLSLVVLVTGPGCQSSRSVPRPVIGITSVYKIDKEKESASTLVNFAYVQAVAENGGVPVVLPTVTDENILRRYVDELDGLVLVGGADIPPSAYDQHGNAVYKCGLRRDAHPGHPFTGGYKSSASRGRGISLGED